MRMITPQIEGPTARVAEGQEGFTPVDVVFTWHPDYEAVPTEKGPLNTAVMAFRPSDEQRAKIAAGADVYVSLLTFMRPQQGIIVMAGKEEASAIYNVKVTP